MPPGDHVRPIGTADGDALEARLARLERQLKRERAIRREAESISESATRQLYDRQQGLVLLETVATAANEATEIGAALTVCLDAIRSHGTWRLGHAWLLDEAGDLVSTLIWSGADARDAEFRTFCEGLVFRSGVGLPGQVLAQRTAVWVSGPEEVGRLVRAEALSAAGLRTAVGFPLLAGSEIVGVLEFFADRVMAPDPETLSLMTQIGTQLGRVVERDRAEQSLFHQATHDPLTGLANRVLIVDALRRSLSRQLRRADDEERLGVFFLDLDGFKAVNDTLGHAAGDRLLRMVAQRLGMTIRPQDTLGRLSGDEFVIVCEALTAARPVVGIAERLGRVLRRPFELDGEQFLVTASVGIVLAEGSERPEALIEQADAAMYQAKALGRARYELFSEELRERIVRQLELERALRHAIERDELCLHYQPEIDLRTGGVVGIEALVRWQRPSGLIMPGEFIRVAEETGMILAIGSQVLGEALEQLAVWQADSLIAEAPWMSVNLSVRQLSDPGLVARVSDALGANDADPARLFLEVTESVILDDAEAGLKVLTALRSLGTEIAIDDFGTGYASLSYLRRFPASVVKVDRSFIAEIDVDQRTRSIVESIVGMARALGLTLVAEGIETAGQLAVVRELGFDIGQGYYFARPAPAGEISTLLRAERPFLEALGGEAGTSALNGAGKEIGQASGAAGPTVAGDPAS